VPRDRKKISQKVGPLKYKILSLQTFFIPIKRIRNLRRNSAEGCTNQIKFMEGLVVECIFNYHFHFICTEDKASVHFVESFQIMIQHSFLLPCF